MKQIKKEVNLLSSKYIDEYCEDVKSMLRDLSNKDRKKTKRSAAEKRVIIDPDEDFYSVSECPSCR